MLTEQDELQAEQAINEYVHIVHEQRAEIKRLNAELTQTRENELFRVRESNQLINENADLRKENVRLCNNSEALRVLLVDFDAAFCTLFPRLTAVVQRLKRDVPYSTNRPPIRSVGS